MSDRIIKYSKEEMKLKEIFQNEKRLRKLLSLEKKRRGVQQEKLVFIGMANLAEYYWCSAESLFKSKEMELTFFANYLGDRIRYSLSLDRINKIPDSDEKLLDIGDEISFNDIEILLKEKKVSHGYFLPILEEEDKVILYTSQLITEPDELVIKDIAKDIAESKGKKLIIKDIIECPPKVRGKFLEDFAEKYPTIRWNFSWKDYVIVGVPDGITNEFVYEFKTNSCITL